MKVSQEEALFLFENFGVELAFIENGKATKIHNGEDIPLSLFIQHNIKDGVLRLSAATCGNSLGDKKLERTPENIELYECRVGRPAKHCSGYSPNKCGVWGAYDLDRVSISVKPTEMIAIFNNLKCK
ncbi:hypothetical protein VCHA53O466_140036 [Vibrio chagasii]|nr:hypothetical protein VCHA53O466_140036 [Vibrio chagasii]